MRKIKLFSLLLLILSACNMQPQTAPTLAATSSGERLPLSEAEVPRVSVEEAKAALDNNAAVIVDVRNSSAFEASHVSGAVSIPLSEIESNPAGLKLEKDQWIITYCT